MKKPSIQLLLSLFALLCFNPLQSFAQCAGGSIVQTPEGQQRVYTCPGDGNPDIVNFTNNGTPNASYAYVVTNNDNIILAINVGNSFDFEVAPPGLCRVFGFSYTGNITAQEGDLVYTTKFSDNCWAISNNAIEVVRDQPDGATVSMPDGRTEYSACLEDGIPDFVGFVNTSTATATYRYVITDDQNNILGIPPTNFLDFDGAGVGICRVWGLSYTGNLTAGQGDNAATTALSDGCFDLSDNFITVTRNTTDGGTVSTPSGENFVSYCTGDGTPDIVDFSHVSSSTADYIYAITDANNIILAITDATSFDFDVAPTGLCRVYGFSYIGNVTAVVGESVFTTRFSDGCYTISSNAIEVQRTGVDGGSVAMPSGATKRYTCAQDGNPDIVMFTNMTSEPGANYAYVITDNQNNILGIPPGNSQDFDGAPVGNCRVWGLSYTGNITAGQGDNAVMTALSDGCFDLSDNFIEILRDNPDGATVSSDRGEMFFTCPGDGAPDVFIMNNTSTVNSNYAYVITSPALEILGISPDGMLDFEGAGPGECWVWGLSYTGNITAAVGDNAGDVALTDDCFDLSDNFVTVMRVETEGGMVDSDKGQIIYTCPGDGVADGFAMSNNSTASANYGYVITTPDLEILGISPDGVLDFEGAGVGECWVWGLSYTGSISAMVGDNAGAVELSADCFDLSDNFVTVFRDNPEGGMVDSDKGQIIYTCPGDGVADAFVMSTNSVANSNYGYVITDPNLEIL
ncbi:MAG: hypothetical protein AAFP19_22410, partial [Bacteroidota bacterium]